MTAWRFLVLAVLIGMAALTGAAHAHDARPLSVMLTEQGRDLYLARVRVPPSVAWDNKPELVWPEGCRVLNARVGQDRPRSDQPLAVACRGGLRGRRLGVRYPIYNPALATLFRLTGLDGQTVTEVLPPDRLTWDVPKVPGFAEVARGYLRLGVEHIWTGVDHLLFVAGLLLLAGTVRRVLLAITGFTLAHSITLSAAALGLVRIPVPPVEAAIALSILFLAREIARPRPEGLARRYPIAVSSSFGLLHGFGFAAALREVGLPKGELAAGLLCFNLGVEIGQIAFIAVVVGAVLAARRAMRWRAPSLAWAPARSAVLAGYGLGVPAAFWFLQRLVLLAG